MTPRAVLALLDGRTLALNEVSIEKLRYTLSVTAGQGAKRTAITVATPPTRGWVGTVAAGRRT